MAIIDHKHLDKDVPYFKDVVRCVYEALTDIDVSGKPLNNVC